MASIDTTSLELEKHEVAAGFVLTCQSHPLSDRVVLSFDDR